MRASVSTTATGRSRRDGGWQALDLAGGEEVAVEVAAEAPLDAGAQDLHGHVAAHAVVDHDGLVHLGDGGGGDRRAELGEMVLEPAAERLLDGARALPAMENGGSLSCRWPQVAGELGPDEVGARREELAELDVAGPQAGQGAGDAVFFRPGRRGTARSATRIGSVAARASCSANGTFVPAGTKRTPCWASTMPARARRNRLSAAEAIFGLNPRAGRRNRMNPHNDEPCRPVKRSLCVT